MKKMLKNKDGLTLISLVVTIIILLILAGISVRMLSGDNGILGQAGNAKTQTDIAGEKEIIEMAVVGAIGKSTYDDFDEISFTNELEKNNATVTKSISEYKVTFSSGRQYTVDRSGNVKEKNPNQLEISELNENASTYFGWDVINYAETLSTELQNTKWQLFYAGPLDGETEERIYLISKEFAKNTDLPTKNSSGPIPADGSDYKAKFSTYQSNANNINDGILPQYTGGSSLIVEEKLKKLNSDYYKDFTSTHPNMRAVAYMMDTSIWNKFSGIYAEYTIGGPTIELLFTAYNKYKGLTGNFAYKADAISAKGYKISNDGGQTYVDKCSRMIENDVLTGTNIIDSPYSVLSINSQADGYWLASPPDANAYSVMRVTDTGAVERGQYDYTGGGFRPLVLLNSNYTLEKTKDSNGNDVFKIVEQ